MCDSTQESPCMSYKNTSKYVDTVTLFAKIWTKGHWPLDDRWPHICWGHMCDSTQGSLSPSPMKIHQSMWIQWPFLQKLEPNVINPWWPFDPTSVEVTCVTLPKDHCILSPMKIHQSMWIQWPIFLQWLHTTYIHTTYRMSEHVVSFWTHFRWDKNKYPLRTCYRGIRWWGTWLGLTTLPPSKKKPSPLPGVYGEPLRSAPLEMFSFTGWLCAGGTQNLQCVVYTCVTRTFQNISSNFAILRKNTLP